MLVPKIIYNSKDITQDLAPELMGFSYTDKTEGEADELSISVKNDKLYWMDGWNPVKGDTITASIIDAKTGANMLPCGDFQVDEIGLEGSADGGHRATIKALSAGVIDSTRTKGSFAHEGKTLLEIAEYVADKYHWTVQGIVHNYDIQRVTQFDETSLGFLHRVAREYGYIFTVKGKVMVFTYLPELNLAQGDGLIIYFPGTVLPSPMAQTAAVTQMMNYAIRDKVVGIYVRGQNSHYNNAQKKMYDDLVAAGANPSPDVLITHHVVDSSEQGLYVTDGRLYHKNMEQVEIDLTIPGNVAVVGGTNVTLQGWKKYDGAYFVATSNHTIDAGGNYVTTASLKRIVPNASTGNKAGTKVGYSKPAASGEPIAAAIPPAYGNDFVAGWY